jgi:YD repeat-containing protein
MALWLVFVCLAKADLSAPSNSLGNASVYGYLLLWVELDEADYGDELKLPVRLAFNSGRQSDSMYLGRNFWVPLAEAKAYPYSEQVMRVELICGQAIYLRKTLKNPNIFVTPDGKTIGVLDGDRFILTEPDSWVTTYKEGKIWQVKTDKGRILTWYYRNNITTEIKDERSGRSAFKVEYGTNGRPNGFSVNGKLHGFEMGKKPRVEYIENKKVVGAMDEALNIWSYPSGKKDTYEFAVTKDLDPTLKQTNKDGVVKNYQWDAKTGRIVSDGDWKYKIENNGERPKLRRYNDKGQEEFVIVDSRNGVYQQKDLEEGTQITEVFKTPGPLYGKVRKVESVLPDGTKKLIYQVAYDEKGRLISKRRENGSTLIFKYDEAGKVTSIKRLKVTDKDILKILKVEEAEKLKEIDLVKENTDPKQMLIKFIDLGLFYMFKMGDYEKAIAFAQKTGNREVIYQIKSTAVNQDIELNRSQKIDDYKKLLAEFPEKKEELDVLIAGTERIRQIAGEYEGSY